MKLRSRGVDWVLAYCVNDRSMMLNNSCRRVLLLSFLFAPNAAVGAKRFCFLSGKLMDNGFDIHVLTIKERLIENVDLSVSGGGQVHRSTMFPRFPRSIRGLASRVFSKLWVDYLCFLDPFSGWILPAVVKGIKIIRKNRIQVLIVSGPPFSPYITAMLLQWVTGVKLILDYRDPWTSHDHVLAARYKSPLVRLMNKVAEKSAIKRTSAVVLCSNIMKELLLKRFPCARNKDVEVIYNGYWPDQLSPVSMEPSLNIDRETKVMIYAGELYGERRIELVARPLRNLINKGIISPNSFRFYIFGKIDNKDRMVLKELDLEGIIIQRERVSYFVIARYLKEADVLFLPSGSTVDYAIPFKFYDYLRARRPILALTPAASELGSIMKIVDCGETADICDPAAIETALAKMIRDERIYTFRGAEAYTWATAVQNYAELLARV
jgi:glycosyltransferase involved in cell wall biosynthesis